MMPRVQRESAGARWLMPAAGVVAALAMAEACGRAGWPLAGAAVIAAVTALCVTGLRRVAPPTAWGRLAVTVAVASAGAAVAIWYLARHGRPFAATGLMGIAAMAWGCGLGIAGIRAALAGATGVSGVARTVVDEALRMRASLVLVVLLVVLIPTLPLVVDHTERLQYRVQFLISWALGTTGLVLSVLTIVLASGSICGDIDSGRIHMTLVKPLRRWEYLLGKWLGIVLFDLLMVALAGVGTATFVQLLARTEATDARDREAVDGQVLTARVAVAPEPADAAGYRAAVEAAIRQLEEEDPAGFARGGAAARRRIRQEHDWQWHTVTADMVSTFVFHDLSAAKRRAAAAGLQLQLKPRAYNVDVDLADVRFAIWLNDRPWPIVAGEHVEQTLATQAMHVLELPADAVDDAGVLRVTIANRNLVPAGETRPTAITFAPGDGMRILYRSGGFVGNFVRGLAVIWIKLAMVAAVAVAAAGCLGLPMAILASLVIYVTALGSGFLRDALGLYNMVDTTVMGAVAERAWRTADLLANLRFYEAFRMAAGFVTDLLLWLTPAFSEFDAAGRLATGMQVPWGDVARCLGVIGMLYPLAFGVAGWAVFDRRDLVRANS